MEWIALTLTALGNMLMQVGIIETLLVAIVGVIMYIAVKYIPIFIKAHFAQISLMQDKFGENLDKISSRCSATLDDMTNEHDKHFDKLIEMHLDIKKLNK